MNILDILKEYVLPFVVFICGIVISWTILNGSVASNTLRIDRLEVKAEENEDTHSLILQELAKINTKLEYIIKEIDSLK